MDISVRTQLYHEFHNSEEAETWAQKYYADLLKLPAEDEIVDMLFSYTGSYYIPINRLLRNSPPFGSKEFKEKNFGDWSNVAEVIPKIYNVLQSYSLPENIVVYRFTHKADIKSLCKGSLRKGMEFSDKAFLSTTLVRHQMEDFRRNHHCNCIMKIYLPKGFPGAYVSLKAKWSCLDEQEFLLLPNVRLKILKICRFTCPLQIDCMALCD